MAKIVDFEGLSTEVRTIGTFEIPGVICFMIAVGISRCDNNQMVVRVTYILIYSVMIATHYSQNENLVINQTAAHS